MSLSRLVDCQTHFYLALALISRVLASARAMRLTDLTTLLTPFTLDPGRRLTDQTARWTVVHG